MTATVTRSFPLRTILSIMHAHELGRRGVVKNVATAEQGKELMVHMYPGIRVPQWREMGHYLRNHFAPLLRKHYPQFANVSVTKVTHLNFDEWMKVQESEFGKTIDVPVVGKSR